MQAAPAFAIAIDYVQQLASKTHEVRMVDAGTFAGLHRRQGI
jgi:hypothetical protein